MAYLDKAGLTELWKKVKSYVDANGGGTPTTITGNAGTATKLQTTRAIDALISMVQLTLPIMPCVIRQA